MFKGVLICNFLIYVLTDKPRHWSFHSDSTSNFIQYQLSQINKDLRCCSSYVSNCCDKTSKHIFFSQGFTSSHSSRLQSITATSSCCRSLYPSEAEQKVCSCQCLTGSLLLIQGPGYEIVQSTFRVCVYTSQLAQVRKSIISLPTGHPDCVIPRRVSLLQEMLGRFVNVELTNKTYHPCHILQKLKSLNPMALT